MHKEFKRLLENATGVSEHVIAINLDIRGFSSFCKEIQDWDVANYIKIVYSKILEEYFKTASFYKPTGDGLIIIIPCERQNLEALANCVITDCLKLHDDFSSLCAEEPLLNFPTPNKIGIGLSRGSICCIRSEEEDKILDYSGQHLNIASRLMDLARPCGIVMHKSFGKNLLSASNKNEFSDDGVYLRGVAEEKPITVHYTKKYTLIPDMYHHPLKQEKWQNDRYKYSYKEIKVIFDENTQLALQLTSKPSNLEKLIVEISHDSPKIPRFLKKYRCTIDNKRVFYRTRGKRHYIDIDGIPLGKQLEQAGLSETTKIIIEITYSVR